jgi:hypothetical protein
MAKNKNIPDNVEKQFNKALFKQGEPVLFTWLGAKKYGYVKTYKTTNWGIQYSVRSNDTTYPCGIQIKGYKTSYHTGCILFEETTASGVDELKKRIDAGPRTYTDSEIFRDAPRPNNESRSSDSNKRTSSDTSDRKTKSNTKRSTRVENDVKPSNNGVQRQHTKTRKNSELDSAIQRQRDFLSGFVKRD